ncbi:hypothetical protein PUN28_019340 [Cardiocondyla obscurior]|uniref:Ribosomal protein S14 n=1 Tax=Cardiocondyla obscurior TaxID=286306 RepID=A0AAW2ED44_9HYME
MCLPSTTLAKVRKLTEPGVQQLCASVAHSFSLKRTRRLSPSRRTHFRRTRERKKDRKADYYTAKRRLLRIIENCGREQSSRSPSSGPVLKDMLR